MAYTNQEIIEIIKTFGRDILASPRMKIQKSLPQHRKTNVYEHSIYVALKSIRIADFYNADVDMKSMVRGALLHDYFLYDWRVPDTTHKLHGFTHSKYALDNASRAFKLNEIEKDIIRKHMFPLNINPPRYKESVIVCLADKICAVNETLNKQPRILNAL